MRRASVAMLLITASTPALAASRQAEETEATRVAARLGDPTMQSAMSGMMVAMTDMVMDLRVDKLRAAIAGLDPEALDDHDRGGARTVGDMIERDDPHFREKLANGTRRAVGTMGAAAGSMAEMMPELRGMAERMGRSMENAMRSLPRD
jgi:hypothetical protein